jgi:hypothetical protein
MELNKKDLEYILYLIEDIEDEGPEDEGWTSPELKAFIDKIKEGVKEYDYGTDITLGELKGHYETHFLTSNQFIGLVTNWNARNLCRVVNEIRTTNKCDLTHLTTPKHK